MPMKTIEGYSKEKYTDTSVLLAGGGAKALSGFIGSIGWDNTNKKITYTPVGGSATDLVTLSWDNISGKPSSFTPSTHSHTDISQKWTTYAGKEYIGWVKIIEWTLNTSNQMPALGFQLHLYRSYNSPSPESYSFDFKSSWGNSGIQIQQINGSTGNQIINKLRFIRDDTNHKLYLEYYVNTSYSTYRNTVTIQVLGFGTGTPITNGLVQTEAETDIVVVKEFTINETGASISGTISNATSATAADTVKVASRSTDASHYLAFVGNNNSTAAAESLYTDGGLVYNPSTNRLIITSSSGQQKEVTVSRTGGSSISLMVGTSNANHGLYSNTASKWIVYSDASGNVTLNGNATTATTASKLGTADVGSASRPIYLAAGAPTQTTYRMAGTNVTATTALAITSNLDTGIWYVNGTNSTDLYSVADGVAYVNKYSDSWIAEIYQDYRTGQIALRGKNNGTWQAWRKVLDSSNFNTWAPKLDGTGATGTWGISVTGSAGSVAWGNVTGKPDSFTPATHNHDDKYVELTGDTMSGDLIVSKNATGDTFLRAVNNNGSISLLTASNRGVYNSTGTTGWLIGTNGTNSWLSIGNVGVGTTSPAYKLDVSGTLRATGQISSTVADGTAPFVITSTTKNENLNADLLDGWNARTIRAYPFNSYTLIDTTPLLQDGLSLDETKCTLVDTVGDGPFRKCWYNNANYTWRSTWVYVHPGDTLTVETWIMKPSNASGTNGTFYIGLECRDVADKVINNNGGTIYVTGLSGISITADSTWKYYRKLFTVPKTHKVYSGSSGKGVYTVRIRANLNYSSGTSPLYWGGVRVFYSDAATYASAIRDKEYHYYDSTTPANGRRASANVNWSDAGLHYFLATSTMSTGKPDNDGHVLHMSWDNGKYEGQLVLPTAESGSLQWRTQGNADNWKAWNTVLDSANYTTYTVKKDGTGASGTWGINISGTAAGLTGYTFKTLSAVSHSGWTNASTDNKIIPTMSLIAYWNGAYNSSHNSNLQYCDRGRFGTIVTKSTTDYAAAGHNHDGDYWPLATETYPYLRPGTSNNWIKIGSANDSYGLLPSQAGAAGSGHNYLGTSSWYWKYAYVDNVTVASNLTASSTVVFSGLSQGTSAPSDETEFLTSYAGTGGFANTTGAGKVYRRTMSLLWDYISGKVGDTYYKVGRNSNNLNSTTTTWNGILPINAFGFRHGKAVWMYSDLDNVTSAAWYNGGSGSGTVTVMTDAEALADNSSYTPSGNASGKVLKIQPTGSIVSNKIGGTSFRTVTAKDNAVWLQVIRAWLPVGASITASMNGTGTGRSYYWITSKEGTGKWEWYACLHINGHGGTMSTFGHTYATLSGAAIGVKWYIASFQIYELTNNNYDALRSRYADSASAVPWSGISDIPSTFTPASHNHAAGDITSGILGVARGGTGKASWTQYGLVYASATTTLAQVSQTWAASKTYWLKAVTNASKVPTYSFVDSLTSDKVTITYDSTGTDYKYVTFTDGQYGEQSLKAHYNLEYIPAIGSLQPFLLNGYITAGYGVYLCRYYKRGGSSTGSVAVGPTGAGIVNGASASGNFSGTDTKVEDGKHTITLTNGTKSFWYVWPVLQVHYNITGSQDDCMEFGWANFYDSSSTGVKNVSPGGTVSFTFCCGRIHCQGSWAARDYVRLTDTPGITITFFGSQAY